MLNQNGGIIGPANIPTTTSAKGKWSLAEYYLAKRQNIWPAVTPGSDPYYPYTTLLLPGNGTNGAQNNTFLDGSTNNFTITRNGNTTQGTFSPFSQTGWGNYFDGTGDYLTVPNGAFNNITTGTIECWVYLTDISAACIIAKQQDGVTTQGLFTIGKYANTTGTLTTGTPGVLYWHPTNTSPATANSTSGIAANTWNHVAIVFDSSAVTFYINGSASGTTNGNYSLPANATPAPTIGQWTADGVQKIGTTGWISNLRIVATAVYTGAFTPPTSPLAATQSAGTNIAAITGTQTSLLTCQSNRFIDNSTNNFTITRNGDTRVVAFSPFNPTASWSAATYGGSGYFDGSGDYLSTPNVAGLRLGAGDFCIEAWIYPTRLTNTYEQAIAGTHGYVSGSDKGYELYLNASGYPAFFIGNTSGVTQISLISSTLVTANAWNHIAAVRNGSSTNNVKLYLNGVQVAQGTTTYDDTWTGADFNIGTTRTDNLTPTLGNSGTSFQGYISNVRFVKGSPVYTAAFTPPTEPLTAITNTSLLLNFTNAGIYDATSKNDLETLDNTVNGVRISTAQSQFGGSSIYFDGTGTDYLWIQADQPIQRFGTAPFTIELWIRLAALGSARGLVAKGTSTTGWLVSLNSSNQVVFTYGTSTITSTGTISQNVWTYIAVVREGTGTNQTKIYIGGSNDGTGTVSTDFTQTSSMYIGANRTGGDLYSGYIQDVRITNGYARTVTTIPTSAFSTF